MYHISFEIDFRNNAYPGKFIVLEGLDASGKSTQAKKLSEYFRNAGKSVLLTHEPTRAGYIGQLIHNVLRGKTPLPRVALQYLFCADRAVHLKQTIIPALEEGKIVISERYFWSSVAYGLTDREEIDYHNQKQVLLAAYSILSMYNQFLLPDMTAYFNISVQVATQRLSRMAKEKEIYEREDQLTKIKRGYDVLLREFPNEFTLIDGEKDEESVTQELKKALSALLHTNT